MGFSLDGYGKPIFTSSPQTVADLQAAADHADRIGGLLKLTNLEREDLTSGETKPGWLISETDTGYLYLVTAAEPQGRLIYADTGDLAISLNGGWTQEPSTSPTPSYRVKGTMASLNGRIRAGTGATSHAFTLPVGARPPEDRVTAVMTDDNTFETVIINASGAVTFFNLVLPAVDYRLASIPPWPVA
jgi:hypothetical protein